MTRSAKSVGRPTLFAVSTMETPLRFRVAERAGLVLLSVLAAVALSGCGPTERPTSAPTPPGESTSGTRAPEADQVPRPIELVQTWSRYIGAEAYPFNRAVDFAYVARNPNQDVGVSDIALHISMLSSDGSVIGTEDFPIGPIRPGETVVGGSHIYAPAEPARVEFTLSQRSPEWVSAIRWKPANYKPLEVNDLTLQHAKGAVDPSLVGFARGHSYFTGTVVNRNSVVVDDFVVDVLRRDATGRITGHYSLFSETYMKISAGGRVAFRLDVPDRLSTGDTYEAVARPWYYREDPLPIEDSNTTSSPK